MTYKTTTAFEFRGKLYATEREALIEAIAAALADAPESMPVAERIYTAATALRLLILRAIEVGSADNAKQLPPARRYED
jgi:hypothetical protein